MLFVLALTSMSLQHRAVAQAAGDPVAGRQKADSERCVECHIVAGGTDGGQTTGKESLFARLAGQSAAYIRKQLMDFRSGAREFDPMAIMSRSITDEDMQDIVAYFSSLPRERGDSAAAAAAAASTAPLRGDAQQLYARGDPARGIVACASCHGAQGEGRQAADPVPLLAGQDWRYLRQQLLDWRSGERHNSAEGAMNKTAKGLSDQDIDGLATYLSGL